jgi:hypothetical protein
MPSSRMSVVERNSFRSPHLHPRLKSQDGRIAVIPQTGFGALHTNSAIPLGTAQVFNNGNRHRLTRKKVVKFAVYSMAGVLGVFGLYLLVLCQPGLFFRYTFAQNRITLYSDEPIPATSATRVLEDVEKRLAGTPLSRHRPGRDIRVYFCNRGWRFILFANYRYRVGGLTYPPLTDNVFLRAVHLGTNRLVGSSGRDVPGERTLSYFIAHEIMHVLIARELGAAGYTRLPTWKDDGYADYVAKGGDFAYERALGQLRSGDAELDPQRSGLYLRYHLLVAYLLDRKGISVREMLNREFDRARLEREIQDGEPEPNSARTEPKVEAQGRARALSLIEAVHEETP